MPKYNRLPFSSEKLPIYIGSKNRIGLPISRLLSGATLFVEPQEYEAYKKAWGDKFEIVQLKENDRGFGYMLQAQLEHARENHVPAYCFMDDDVDAFTARKTIDQPTIQNFLEGAIHALEERGLSQVQMSFAPHNWYVKDSVEPWKNYTPSWCVFVNKTEDLLKVGGFRTDLPLFNDYEMSARLVKNGFKTATWYEYLYSHTMNKVNLGGGLHDLYKNRLDKIEAAANLIVEEYGAENVRRVVGGTGLPEIRFRYKKLIPKVV